ncbi:DUF6270 domain-containing protein [Stutzerimonas stutzeri]|uniref:DUF6270 domain-containing protein n=1 Tax=Stutzerimonas stutzeri TaxID=316 RepID=UPI00210CF04D|nr:DUF6270 domain-containing protein [Stutzerimonas stutzeri]MCQ4239548.1 heparinase II/III family protein [Stutzerimonas stutzeri]
MRFVIFGSSVTRDAFEFVDKTACELVRYFARSSLGSAYAEGKIESIDVSRIDSEFQRGIVCADLNKEFRKFLDSGDFDCLIYDPIDERFDLLLLESEGLCTLSNELKQAFEDKGEVDGRRLASGSEEFYERWEDGWSKLIAQLDSLGKRAALRINKVLWADSTVEGENFEPNYDAAAIKGANEFLGRVYSRMLRDIPHEQFFEFTPELLIGANEHKWGKSPFHFVDAYYRSLAHLLECLAGDARQRCTAPGKSMVHQLSFESCVVERKLECSSLFGVLGGRFVDAVGAESSLIKVAGKSKTKFYDDHVLSEFSGAAGSFELRLRLVEPVAEGNGISVCYRLSNWQEIRYLAIGYTVGNVFRHVKIPNARQDIWENFSFSVEDLIYGFQSKWVSPGPSQQIEDIRLYVKGTPGEAGAQIGCKWAAAWKELPYSVEDFPFPRLRGENNAPSSNYEVVDAIVRYIKDCNFSLEKHAREFLASGRLPLNGDKFLSWGIEKPLPDRLEESGTYRYLWHSMHPARTLMVYGKENSDLAAVFAARDYISAWLDRSYFSPDPDIKFAWYDHGTAERLLAFLLMHEVGREQSFDFRFMSRLRSAILKHGNLLESEAFYAAHQPTRYHNHAWFQDMALIAAGQIMVDYPCADRWLSKGVARLTDQLEKLLVRDQGYAIFVENSIGYHHGIQHLAKFAGNLTGASGRDSVIPQVAQELSRWSDFLRYPDNRSPTHGDTFRLPNVSEEPARRGKPYSDPLCLVLDKAGYAVVKGNQDRLPFMLCMFATSICKTHKHEDNLSITLFFDGIEWLIDPSFFSHEYSNSEPAFLKSAAAHSAICIDEVEYDISPGLAFVSGASAEGRYSIEGTHLSYEDAEVSRSINGRLDVLDIFVKDKINSPKQRTAKLVFSLGEGVYATKQESIICLRHRVSSYQLEIEIMSAGVRSEIVPSLAGGGFMQLSEVQRICLDVPLETGEIIWKLRAVDSADTRFP